MKKITVKPAEGRRVRIENGRRHIREEGEAVVPSTYYRRRLADGDLVEVDAVAADTEPAAVSAAEPVTPLKEALAGLEQDNPDHWTESGKPDLNHLIDVLNRRVTRKEVDQAMKEMEA